MSVSASTNDAVHRSDESTPLCRLCNAPLVHEFVDLGMSPLCESYISPENRDCMEPFYPLRVLVCDRCFLVQIREYVRAEEIYSDYAYFSSYSTSWLEHARRYTQQMIARFGLNSKTRVVEVASNDGYLLQYFAEQGIPALGIEPAANVAAVAQAKGIETIVRFFGQEAAADLVRNDVRADLLLGNNVLAHVPDLNGFVAGLKTLLADTGVITMEFPHLLQLIDGNQFDTIYHEHFSYLSFLVVCRLFREHGLTVFDVDELPTHGGSLRVYAQHDTHTARPVAASVGTLLDRERQDGYERLDTYQAFRGKVEATKRALLRFLIEAKQEGRQVVGYGAPGKGNTLLNFCGIRTDFLDYTVDRSPHKQGMFLPGTRVPIYAPERIEQTKPQYVLILPWNLKEEIMKQLSGIRQWGGRFVVPIPELAIL